MHQTAFLCGEYMHFNFVVPNTARGLMKFQFQMTASAYPIWVRLLSYSVLIVSIFGLTALLNAGFTILVEGMTEIQSRGLAFFPALLFAYVLTSNVVMPKANLFTMRFARFDLDLQFTGKYHISEVGLTIDDADRSTRIAWSAIGGVYETKDFVAFHCRGLNYFIARDIIGGEAEQSAFLTTCKTWQKSAQGDPIAKAFI